MPSKTFYMMPISIRIRVPAKCLRGTPLPRSTTPLKSPLSHGIRTMTTARQSRINPTTATKVPWATPTRTASPFIQIQFTPSTQKSYSTAAPPTADTLIDEIQDAYEIAKDEFEIATESTDGGTIYAASDRDSARDALNDLCAIYYRYAAKPGEEDTGIMLRSGKYVSGSEMGEEVPGVDAVTAFKTEDVPQEVKDEVRRRVGQRIRELRNAVELLEERATEE